MRIKSFLSVLIAISVLTGLLAVSCGDDPVEPVNPPQITIFSTTNSDIMPGDSSLVTYKALNASSLTLQPGNVSLTPVDSGDTYVKPSLPTTYTLVATNADGVDSASLAITMSQAQANISQFSVSEPRILTGDSTILTWAATLADSIVVNNGIGRLPSSSGAMTLKPTSTTTYTAVAYNIANDTVSVTVTVEVPSQIEARNGVWYRGDMGSSVVDPPLEFLVQDAANAAVTQAWVHFEIVDGEGDGTFAADSVRPGTAVFALPEYTFSGALGHAVIRAKVKGVDSVDVNLRANTLIPGLGGQGQYIKFGDLYSTVKALNGEPADVAYSFPLNYIDYEAELGVVIMVIDDIADQQPTNNEIVYGVIVNNEGPGYDKTMANGIGIGAHYDDLVAAFGLPDTTWLDGTPPPANVYQYYDPPMDFFADPSDSIVFEIHLKAPLVEGMPGIGLSQGVSRMPSVMPRLSSIKR